MVGGRRHRRHRRAARLDVRPDGCAQSHRNYPKLLAAALEVPTFRDATCGSATTDDFYAPQTGLPTGETNPAQFDRLTPTTDLVTVGIGGNDAGFAGAAMDCISPDPRGAHCKEKYTAGGVDQLEQRINASEPKLVAALQEIHRRSPNARVLMLDYLAGIPEHACYPTVPISESDMAYLYATFQKLNAMVKRAAPRAAPSSWTPTRRRWATTCAQLPTERYVEGLGVLSVNGPAVAVPAHPNSAGAASQFRSTLAAVGSSRASPRRASSPRAWSSRARAPSRARWQTFASSSPCSHRASDSARLVPPCSRVRTTSMSWSRASS